MPKSLDGDDGMHSMPYAPAEWTHASRVHPFGCVAREPRAPLRFLARLFGGFFEEL
jgi:hypothetical protein